VTHEEFLELDDIQKLKHITRMVRHCVMKGQCLDVEGIAVDIWTEIWQSEGEKRVCWLHIRNRVVDRVRKARREATIALTDELEDILEEKREDTFNTIDTSDFLDEVMRCPKLGPLDRKFLYMKFYQNMSGSQIADELGGSLSKAKVNVQIAATLKMLAGWARDYCGMVSLEDATVRR